MEDRQLQSLGAPQLHLQLDWEKCFHVALVPQPGASCEGILIEGGLRCDGQLDPIDQKLGCEVA